MRIQKMASKFYLVYSTALEVSHSNPQSSLTFPEHFSRGLNWYGLTEMFVHSIIITKKYKRIYDSDYNTVHSFCLSGNWDHRLWKLKLQVHKTETANIGFVLCKIG